MLVAWPVVDMARAAGPRPQPVHGPTPQTIIQNRMQSLRGLFSNNTPFLPCLVASQPLAAAP